MPNLSWRTFARGARQLVVQEAFEIYEFRVGVEESSGLWLGAKKGNVQLGTWDRKPRD